MWFELLVWVLAFAVFVAVLLFAASRKTSGRSSRVGNALQPFRGVDLTHLLNLQSIYEPGSRQLLERRQSEEREEDDAGDPPRPGES
jgi:HAMP domain-containing protein